jgi:hypothetical protein
MVFTHVVADCGCRHADCRGYGSIAGQGRSGAGSEGQHLPWHDQRTVAAGHATLAGACPIERAGRHEDLAESNQPNIIVTGYCAVSSLQVRWSSIRAVPEAFPLRNSPTTDVPVD